jgi:hypothetical protein
LLNNIKTYQFSERLSGLPEIVMDLEDLQANQKIKSAMLDRPVDIYLKPLLQ